MAFGKHALKVIAVFVVLFLVGVILKLLGVFDGNSLENFTEHNPYANMSDNEFRKYVRAHSNSLNNIPSDVMNSLSNNQKRIVDEEKMQV